MSSAIAAGTLSLALLALAPFGVSIGSSDSTALLNTIHFTLDGNADWLLESQEAPIPYLLYGPWMLFSEHADPLVIVPIMATVLLVMATAAVGTTMSGRTAIGIFAASLLLASPVLVAQSRFLPLYPLFTLFGLLGIWMLARSPRDARNLKRLIVGAVLVALAVMTHGAGLFFLVVAVATIVLAEDREGVKRYALSMLFLGAALTPWLISHLVVGGLSGGIMGLLSPRATWVISQGYLTIVNTRFWGAEIHGIGDALASLGPMLPGAMGWLFWLALPLAAVGFLTLGWRRKIFVVVAVAALAAPLVFLESRYFPRYSYPALPAVVLLAARGLGVLWDRMRAADLGAAIATSVVAVAAVATFIVNLQDSIDLARAQEASAREDSVRRMAARVGDGAAVIGTRPGSILLLESTEIDYLFADLVSEQEFVAYLTWDEAVLKRMLQDRRVGWALVRKPPKRWEVEYNRTWLEPAYGRVPVHVEELASGDASCLAYDGPHYRLYRLFPERLGSNDRTTGGAPRC